MAVGTKAVTHRSAQFQRGQVADLGMTLERWTGASGANAAVTVSTDTDQARRLLYVTVHYSATPTHAGITVTLNSNAGANYDTELDASAANAEDYLYLPAGELKIREFDAIDVLAPAGGAGIVSYVSIYTEPL